MSDLENSCNQYTDDLFRISEEAFLHYDLYYKEIAETDPNKAQKIMAMAFLCSQISKVSSSLK